MKNAFSYIFGRKSKIIKYISVLKNIFVKIKIILPLVKSDKLKFILKIIQGQYHLKFQPNIDNEKIYFKNKYQFNYNDWFSNSMNTWKNYLIPLKEIKYLEIGSFEGRSAVFVGELNNVKEMTCVDTFEGSDEHKNINFDLVYKNCSENLKKLNKSYNLIKDTSHNFFQRNNKTLGFKAFTDSQGDKYIAVAELDSNYEPSVFVKKVIRYNNLRDFGCRIEGEDAYFLIKSGIDNSDTAHDYYSFKYNLNDLF